MGSVVMASEKRGLKAGRLREASRRFAEIAENTRKYELTADQLSGLDQYKELQRAGGGKASSKLSGCFWALAFVIGVSLLGLVAALVVVDRRELSRAWLERVVGVDDLQTEYCVLDRIELVQDMFRPPVDCRICRNVTFVEKVSNMSRERFEADYAYSSRPVVITDSTANWSALNTFSFDFFKQVYSAESPALTTAKMDCQFFGYSTNFENLGQVLNMSEDQANLREGAKPWYIGWSNCDGSVANVLRQHYQKPYFLPEVAESSKIDWIFMGSPGYGAHLHIDAVGDSSWQAQIKGTKRWTLEPPPECFGQCQSVLEVVINPGEILVVDTNKWFHKTLILGDQMSITIGSEYD